MLQTSGWQWVVLYVIAWLLILIGVVTLALALHRKSDTKVIRGPRVWAQQDIAQEITVEDHGRRAVVGLGVSLLGGVALWVLDFIRLSPEMERTVSPTSASPSTSRTALSLNLRDFGAVGDGVADDGPALRRALDELRSQGGGTLFLPPGIYQCQVLPIPTNTKRSACAWIPSNTQIVGAGAGATVIRLGPDCPDQTIVLCNDNQGQGLDTNIGMENLTIDGNSAHQNKRVKIDRHNGLVFNHVTGVTVRNVLFRDVFGLSSGSQGPNGTPAEGFHTDCVGCMEILYDTCRVQCNRALPTASGFSLDGSASAVYRNCTASGLRYGQGFTHWRTKDVVYDTCRAYDCLQDGFHSEYAESITYIACTSGKNWLAPYIPGSSNQTTAGNRIGFHIFHGKNVLLAYCIGRGNAFYGARFEHTVGGRVVGGSYTGNAQYGLRFEDAQTVDQADISGSPNLSENGMAHMWYSSSVTQYPGPLNSPELPASGQQTANPFPFATTVYVSGGEVSKVLLEGKDVGATTGAFPLRSAGGTITLFYSSPPTWSWFSA